MHWHETYAAAQAKGQILVGGFDLIASRVSVNGLKEEVLPPVTAPVSE